MPRTSNPGRRTAARPNGAYKLLATLLYWDGHVEAGKAPLIEWSTWEGVPGYLRVNSITRLSRILGTEPKKVRAWLAYLTDHYYISHLHVEGQRKSRIYVKLYQPEIWY